MAGKKVVKGKRRIARKESVAIGKRVRVIETLFRIIIFFAVIGLLVSIYLTWLHLKPLDRSFCTSCEVVVKGDYGTVFWIPVALIGLLGYLLLVVMSAALLAEARGLHPPRLNPKRISQLIMLFAIIGFVYSAYLTGIQWFVIHTWCVMCATSFIVITVIMVLSIVSYSICIKLKRKLQGMGVKPESVCRYC